MSRNVISANPQEEDTYSQAESDHINLEAWMIEDLMKSGLVPSDIGLVPLKNDDQLWKYLGYNRFGGRSILEVGGYFIKYPMIEYHRLKLKKPINDAKYLSPINKGNHAFIPPEVAKIALDYKPDDSLFFSEGEKKSSKATKEGFPTIGLPGVWCFKDSENDFLKELENLKIKNRKCNIVFDSDIISKQGVQQAELRLAVELINRGAIPISIRFPGEVNGDKVGLDDFIVQYGRDAFHQLVYKGQQTIELLINEGIKLEMALKEIARIKSATVKSKYVNQLANREEVSKRDIKADLRKYEPVLEAKSEKKSFSAVFEGLVDIVDQDGTLLYLVKEDHELLLQDSIEINGEQHYPPPRENVPFNCIPRAEEVMKYYVTDTDSKLYEDLIEYHKSISELPKNSHYDLLVAFDFLTYCLEQIQYSPYLWLFAIPERGKSRTGKGIIYVCYRGIHVESLREAYLFRLADNWNATIFFDVMDISRKAEKAGSDDILLQRFEKGVKVARVHKPDKGPHKDTVYYDVFGSSIIATNQPLDEILETRAIMISMPESNKKFENDVRPEVGLPFKERLLAFRARHLGKELPETQKPVTGRLGDIVKPLLQIIRLVNPQREEAFLHLVREIENERKENRSESFEAKLLKVIMDLKDSVYDSLLPVKLITEKLNAGEKEKYHTNERKIGWRLKSLGFEKRKRSHGSSIVWDFDLINKLLERFGLNRELNFSQDSEKKRHECHEHHTSKNDSNVSSDVSNGLFSDDIIE